MWMFAGHPVAEHLLPGFFQNLHNNAFMDAFFETSRVIEGFSSLRPILSISSM